VCWMFVGMDAFLTEVDVVCLTVVVLMLCLLYDAGGGCSMDGLLFTMPVGLGMSK
jgi:hypothetical protein